MIKQLQLPPNSTRNANGHIVGMEKEPYPFSELYKTFILNDDVGQLFAQGKYCFYDLRADINYSYLHLNGHNFGVWAK